MNSKTFYHSENISTYEKENRNFIIKNNLEDQLRCVRVHLLNNVTDKFYYDIIISKVKKMSLFDQKRKDVLMLKASMGVLTEKELNEQKKEEDQEKELNNNIYFYKEITELIVDINFKNYLLTNYNSAFLSDGTEIASFEEINDWSEEIFVAELVFQKDFDIIRDKIKKIIRDKQEPELFSSDYKSIIDKKSLELMLPNIAKSGEFSNRKDTMSPDELNPVIKKQGYNHELVFRKTLNKLPLRKKNYEVSTLPTLPHIFQICSKPIMKNSSLRDLFKNQYSHPTKKKERSPKPYEEEKLVEKENRLLLQFKKNYNASCSPSLYHNIKQNVKLKAIKENSIEMTNGKENYMSSGKNDFNPNNSIENENRLKKTFINDFNKEQIQNKYQSSKNSDKTYISKNTLSRANMINNFKSGNSTNFKSDKSNNNLFNNFWLPTIISKNQININLNTKSNKPNIYYKIKNFELDEVSADKIKERFKVRNFNKNEEKKRTNSVEELKGELTGKETALSQLKSRPLIKSIMSKYHYSIDKMERIVFEYCIMCKASHDAASSLVKSSTSIQPSFEEILRKTKMLPSEYFQYLRKENIGEYSIFLEIVKEYFPVFRNKSTETFPKLLNALDIKSRKINLEDLTKIKFFLLDMKSDREQSVEFCLKVI